MTLQMSNSIKHSSNSQWTGKYYLNGATVIYICVLLDHFPKHHAIGQKIPLGYNVTYIDNCINQKRMISIAVVALKQLYVHLHM